MRVYPALIKSRCLPGFKLTFSRRNDEKVFGKRCDGGRAPPYQTPKRRQMDPTVSVYHFLFKTLS
jgi:hypothetical protein